MHVHCHYTPACSYTTVVNNANSTTCLTAMSLYACHQPHDCVAGCCARLGSTMSPTTPPQLRHSSSKMLTSGGVSAQEHLPFVTPSRSSSSTECQQMATLHLSQQRAPFASLSLQPQIDAQSADVAPQTPLTAPMTQTNNGCVGSMLKPSDKLQAATTRSNKATWLHWTLADGPSSQQLCTTPIKTAGSTCRTYGHPPCRSTAVSAGVRKGGTRSAAAMSTRQRVRSGCKMLQLLKRPCWKLPLPRQQTCRPLGVISNTDCSTQMQYCLTSQNLVTAR